METLFWLLFGHCLADFALQNEAMSAAKRRTSAHSCPWQIAMCAHAMIHAGFVTFFTSSIALGLLEFVFHFAIDFAKCEGFFGPGGRSGHRIWWIDQALHVGCKVGWAVFA